MRDPEAMNEQIAQFDAIVIGAGFGGLYALHHLREEMARGGLRHHALMVDAQDVE